MLFQAQENQKHNYNQSQDSPPAMNKLNGNLILNQVVKAGFINRAPQSRPGWNPVFPHLGKTVVDQAGFGPSHQTSGNNLDKHSEHRNPSQSRKLAFLMSQIGISP